MLFKVPAEVLMGCTKFVRMRISTQHNLPSALCNHRENMLHIPKDRNYLTDSIKYGLISNKFPQRSRNVFNVFLLLLAIIFSPYG